MKIIWTPEAEQDRADIWDYLAARDPDAALRIDSLLSDAVARLAAFPMLGHEGEVSGTRELTPHRSYRSTRSRMIRSGSSSSSTPLASGRLYGNHEIEQVELRLLLAGRLEVVVTRRSAFAMVRR